MQMYLNNNLWQRTNFFTNCSKRAIQWAGDALLFTYLLFEVFGANWETSTNSRSSFKDLSGQAATFKMLGDIDLACSLLEVYKKKKNVAGKAAN